MNDTGSSGIRIPLRNYSSLNTGYRYKRYRNLSIKRIEVKYYGRRKEEERIFLGDEGINDQDRWLLWLRGNLWLCST